MWPELFCAGVFVIFLLVCLWPRKRRPASRAMIWEEEEEEEEEDEGAIDICLEIEDEGGW